ncbi:hypothetical protein PV386_16235 [Streptomyces europaeiscabiei]|nr:hypothetical protein [Streptomyces europaeiscabiei]MDX2759949.1 hypothetical protein [Streptomyces europaeiscabiei]
MPLGADAEKTAAATFAGGVFPTQKTASPSPSTLSVRSACALNRDHVALRAGCLIHANRLWYSSSTTSSMLTTRSRATFTKSAVCAFTGAATHIAASVTARASPGLCLSPRRSRTADGQRSSLRPESASGTVPAASPA